MKMQRGNLTVDVPDDQVERMKRNGWEKAKARKAKADEQEQPEEGEQAEE